MASSTGIELETEPRAPVRAARLTTSAGRHRDRRRAPRAATGSAAVEEYTRLQRLAPPGQRLKASVPGAYTLPGRSSRTATIPDRHAITEALVPIVRDELVAPRRGRLRRDRHGRRAVDELLRLPRRHGAPRRHLQPDGRAGAGRCHLGTHLCFGNYKARAVAPRRYAPMFPAFLDLAVDEIHVEMASREFAELELIAEIAEVRTSASA